MNDLVVEAIEFGKSVIGLSDNVDFDKAIAIAKLQAEAVDMLRAISEGKCPHIDDMDALILAIDNIRAKK